MYLRPSDIYFSQDSINNVFDKNSRHAYQQIGITLDRLCEGRASILDIPKIRVMRSDEKWISADNRRLWVFREMERLGKCQTIEVYQTYYIPSRKMTSYNGGVSIDVRGSPGGHWHSKRSVRKTEPVSPKIKDDFLVTVKDPQDQAVNSLCVVADTSVVFNVNENTGFKYGEGLDSEHGKTVCVSMTIEQPPLNSVGAVNVGFESETGDQCEAETVSDIDRVDDDKSYDTSKVDFTLDVSIVLTENDEASQTDKDVISNASPDTNNSDREQHDETTIDFETINPKTVNTTTIGATIHSSGLNSLANRFPMSSSVTHGTLSKQTECLSLNKAVGIIVLLSVVTMLIMLIYSILRLNSNH